MCDGWHKYEGYKQNQKLKPLPHETPPLMDIYCYRVWRRGYITWQNCRKIHEKGVAQRRYSLPRILERRVSQRPRLTAWRSKILRPFFGDLNWTEKLQ